MKTFSPLSLLSVAAALALAVAGATAAAETPAADSQGPLLAWRLSPIAHSASQPAKIHVPAAGGATQRPLADLLADAGLWDQRVLCTEAEAQATTVVVLQQPGVHAVDLVKSKDHPIVSAIKSALSSAPATLEIPHFHIPSSATPLTILHSAASCPPPSSKVTYIHHTLPSLSSATPADADQITDLLRQHPNALFMYSSAYALAQRVESASSSSPASGGSGGGNSAQPAVGDFNKLPYIAQYHIFTPGLFMTLSVTIMLVAFLMVGVSWLASVKAPVGMEGSKLKGKPKTA